MTLITVNAVVDIPRHIVVLEIVRVVIAVASGALEDGIVIGIDMARGTDIVRVAVTGRERRVLGVIKRCTRPGGGVMAGLARRREKLRLGRVSRIRRVVVIGLVATDAGRGQSRVVIVDMAVRTDARRHRVRTSQGEGGVVVIESGVGPDGRVVAKFARGRETGRRVGGIRRAGVILLVARVAECAVE